MCFPGNNAFIEPERVFSGRRKKTSMLVETVEAEYRIKNSKILDYHKIQKTYDAKIQTLYLIVSIYTKERRIDQNVD